MRVSNKLSVMRTVTERHVLCFFAAAEVHFSCILCLKSHGRELSPLMRSIAERLVGALAAGAPEVGFTCLAFDCVRRVLRADCVRHDFSRYDNVYDVGFSSVRIKMTSRFSIKQAMQINALSTIYFLCHATIPLGCVHAGKHCVL